MGSNPTLSEIDGNTHIVYLGDECAVPGIDRSRYAWWLRNRHKYPNQILPNSWSEAKILREFVDGIKKDQSLAEKHKDLLEKTLREIEEMEKNEKGK